MTAGGIIFQHSPGTNYGNIAYWVTQGGVVYSNNYNDVYLDSCGMYFHSKVNIKFALRTRLLVMMLGVLILKVMHLVDIILFLIPTGVFALRTSSAASMRVVWAWMAASATTM